MYTDRAQMASIPLWPAVVCLQVLHACAPDLSIVEICSRPCRV